MRATWLHKVLVDAGLTVVRLPGWETRGDHFDDVWAVVWHHDGSPPGASPGVPAYMAGQIDKGKPGAQCWVGLDGTWHLVAAGAVAHAGRVLPGKPGNPDSIGVETDHTTGETWSGVILLDSLRRGTRAIADFLGRGPDALEFHKTICSPVGRKTDPDGLDLATERAATFAAKPAAPGSQEDLLMPAAKSDDDARRCLIRDWCWRYWGQPPTQKEQDLLAFHFGQKGADLTLAAITDHANAKKHRART